MAGCKAFALLILLNITFFTSVSTHEVPSCPPTKPPSAPSAPKTQAKCPKDTLKFGVCGEWLGLVTEVIGAKPSSQCCSLIKGLADLEAALCLCTAIKAKVLGALKVDVPIAISLVINGCGKKVPEGFVCG
ncbi:bifunctional inhibitor/lipid-transfer protein/seed storage 2S albumin superfamily protein [Actinidia rufa]|uniref:Bifunctional inhibitor/lipid-transfer protein/seed storage 2S albumin superfamily protein n=1 Tax=Actinidia rufa TaxID=165716 RepID=A0A7J0F1W6_9ERIC|nr:bifunctional inhibitor/lipid-transfer protein/seed storage 2S albumin superfamily protein [Actinidia rufa]